MCAAPAKTTPATSTAAHAASVAGSDDFAAAAHPTPTPPTDPGEVGDLLAQVEARLRTVFEKALDEALARQEARQEARLLASRKVPTSPTDPSAALRQTFGDDVLVTRDELARLLGLHPKTVASLVREGKLPEGGKLGGSSVYSLGAVRAILRTVAGPAASAPARGRKPRGGGRA